MKKYLIILFCYFITFPAFAENTILIVGDSISAAYGMDPEKGWVALLRKRLQNKFYNYKVINASVSGATTSNGLERLPVLLTRYQPQITIIELGGNDGLRGLPLAVIKKNLDSLIQLASQAHSKVVVLGLRLPPNYGPRYIKEFQAIFEGLEKRTGLVVVPFFLEKVDDQDKLMQPDRVHPTESAQAQLLENVWPFLEKSLKKH
jgi:acyl-CoA thioesterase-1